MGLYEKRLIARGLEPKTSTWNEIFDKSTNYFENEELLLTNTYLNSQIGEFADFTDKALPQVKKIKWADDGSGTLASIIQENELKSSDCKSEIAFLSKTSENYNEKAKLRPQLSLVELRQPSLEETPPKIEINDSLKNPGNETQNDPLNVHTRNNNILNSPISFTEPIVETNAKADSLIKKPFARKIRIRKIEVSQNTFRNPRKGNNYLENTMKKTKILCSDKKVNKKVYRTKSGNVKDCLPKAEMHTERGKEQIHGIRKAIPKNIKTKNNRPATPGTYMKITSDKNITILSIKKRNPSPRSTRENKWSNKRNVNTPRRIVSNI